MSGSRRAALPLAVRDGLEAIFESPVEQVQVIEYSRFLRLHGRAIATTRRNRIYLRDSAAGFFADPWLMLHEYWHVIGQWESGRLTVWRYLRECLRRGYWMNAFEVEAREFADRHAAELARRLSLPVRWRSFQPSKASRR
jgi:hypothetical protein